MHQIESYAAICGSKIGKPFISELFYPIPFQNYIVLGRDSNFEKYKYWDDVFGYLKFLLKEKNIGIVDLKSEQDDNLSIPNCIDGSGANMRQVAHIIKNSLLYVGFVGFESQINSFYQKNSVILCGNSYENNVRPYFGGDYDFIVADNFMPKTSNLDILVKPEVIANKIISRLGFEPEIKEETVFIGALYSNSCIDVVPRLNFNNQFENKLVNLRLDLCDDREFLENWLKNSKVNIITNSYIPIEILRAFKDNVVAVNCNAESNFSKKEIENMRRSGVKINFFARNNIVECRNKYFDEHVFELKYPKPKLDAPITDYSLYSKRRIYDLDGVYLSPTHWKNKISGTNKMIEDPELLNDCEYFRIVKTK